MSAPMSQIRRFLGSKLTLGLIRHNSLEIGNAPIVCNGRSFAQTCRGYCISTEGASAGVDIGLPERPVSRRLMMRERKADLKKIRSNAELERASRRRTLLIPLDQVQAETELTTGPSHTRRIAHHYGIFADLFDSADFLDVVPMEICYECNESGEDSSLVPVYTGNVVMPQEASKAPNISYESEKDSLWTLMLTNPDGHLLDNNAEYIHWLVGNIPGDSVNEGEVLADYLPPFPPKGTGYHRMIFVLFQQSGTVDYSKDRLALPCSSLHERTFSTLEFYRHYQHMLTPAGLRFFQSRWDASVQGIYHDILDMREPVFEYDFPPTYIAQQKKWPHKKPLHYLKNFMPQE